MEAGMKGKEGKREGWGERRAERTMSGTWDGGEEGEK